MDKTEQSWRECLGIFNIESATLLWQSSCDAFRRIYAGNEHIYKVVDLRRETTSNLRVQDLAGEFAILKNCEGIQGIPSATAHLRTGQYEVLVMKGVEGVPLSKLHIGWFRLLSILAKLSIILLKLSWRGISHNDIRPDNILITDDNSIYLVDFDQACRTTFIGAIARQFFGINTGVIKVHGSIMSILRNYILGAMPPRVVKILRRLFSRKAREKLRALPVLRDDASFQIKTLLKAWQIAQESDANSPGQNLAYYSLSLEGYCFPGERPWCDRWNMLRSITDYSGKRILELGCNMALLSTYLLKYSNAGAALAVDIDDKILESAKLINTAFGVKASLKVQNLDAPDDWESELIDFKPDIVFALNVLNWIQEKQRLLNFLGHFQEVIYEGHDGIDVESSRLRSVGFQHIEIAGLSERGREVIHCRR
jgi:predicted Ser/Thr protein kinase